MRYTFRNIAIDADCFAIWQNGILVEAEPRVLEFIFYLVRHRERMVSKQELLQEVWQTHSISESVLTRAASMARKLLGDSALIRTVYGRGYQWMGPTEPTLPLPYSERASAAQLTSGVHPIACARDRLRGARRRRKQSSVP
jgi:DNA-binding winged helix-turn-helix (wHTH) protein